MLEYKILNSYKLIITVLFLLLQPFYIWGEARDLTGVVLNSETNESIPNVVLRINELEKTFTTSEEGTFKVEELEYGTYTFILNHIGYIENVSVIIVNEGTRQLLVFYLIPKNIELDPVIISDYRSFSKFDDLQELSNVLKGKDLQKQLGLTLASTLKNEAGLAIRSMGPAPSRPVIRGLGSDRVLISEDGIKTIDLSATSSDHAVTIDPFTLSRIEVLRGPRVLTQTSTTIGGIVNVVRNDIPEIVHKGITGQLGLFGETVNSGYLGFLGLTIPFEPLVIRGEISRRETMDLDTPVGELKNSESANLNFNIASSYIFSEGYVGMSFRRFELDYGVPGGFIGAHPNGVDISMDKTQFNITSKLSFEAKKIDNIEWKFSRVYYRHKEFEKSGAIGSEFKIINYFGEFRLNHNEFEFLKSGSGGISANFRDFNIGGFVFTPPTRSINISTYIFENLAYKRINFEFGARYNFDIIKPESEIPNANIGYVRERSFNTYSLSASVLYQQSDHVYFGGNVSKSSRVPTIEELFSEGPHLAAYSFEIGNPDLDAESGLGTELFIYHKFEDLFFNFNFFRNDLNNYIIPRNIGEINYSTFLPIYKTVGVGALLYGFESSFEWGFCEWFELVNTISYTKGEFKKGGNLPQIPPLKGLIELKYRSEIFNLGISGEWASKQYKIDDFEEPTNGYFVMNLFLQYSLINMNNTSNFSLSIDNIFNAEYRNHLSRVKSILPEAGRNFKLSYKMYFHF